MAMPTAVSHYLQIDGCTSFVETAGEGEPLFCIHSAGQSGLQWRNVLLEMPQMGYRVIVVDLPGHGRSDSFAPAPSYLPAPVSISAYRDWCIKVLSELSAAPAWIVGCSIGGKIALELAAGNSKLVRGVVAMGCDANNSRLDLNSLQLSLEDSASPSRADRTYYGTLAACGSSVPLRRAEAIAAFHRREDPSVTIGDLVAWTRHDMRARLSSIDRPVHLVVGEDDFWIHPPDVEWAAQQIPEASCEFLDGVGHYPVEELEKFSYLLAGWIDELRSR
jgi:pimeloyl-ACP methyl ester carboxylesterase